VVTRTELGTTTLVRDQRGSGKLGRLDVRWRIKGSMRLSIGEKRGSVIGQLQPQIGDGRRGEDGEGELNPGNGSLHGRERQRWLASCSADAASRKKILGTTLAEKRRGAGCPPVVARLKLRPRRRVPKEETEEKKEPTLADWSAVGKG
jgi:hypothetical protein